MKENIKYRSDFLFPKTSFLIGVGSVLNISGRYFTFNYSRTGKEADSKAIESDWGVIGLDIKNVFLADKRKKNMPFPMTKEIKKNNEKQEKDKEEIKEPDEGIIPEELKPIIEDPDISGDTKDKIIKAFIQVCVSRESSFSGPLPPPDVLKGYNEIVDDGAERIVTMAEKQSDHRM